MLDPNIFDTKVLTPDLMNRKVVKLRRCRRALVQVEEKWLNLIYIVQLYIAIHQIWTLRDGIK